MNDRFLPAVLGSFPTVTLLPSWIHGNVVWYKFFSSLLTSVVILWEESQKDLNLPGLLGDFPTQSVIELLLVYWNQNNRLAFFQVPKYLLQILDLTHLLLSFGVLW